MEVVETILFILLGALMGIIGQGLRAIVGIRKNCKIFSWAKRECWFSFHQLIISLIIGGVAGSLGAVFMLEAEIERELLLTLVTVGYAGTDFIESFIDYQKEKLPISSNN